MAGQRPGLTRYAQRMTPPLHWPSFLRQIYALEQSWNAHKVTYPRDDAVPWLPLPIPQFISMLTDAVMAAPTRWEMTDRAPGGPAAGTFLDVGCGPGTKVRLAEALFGLKGHGIDIVPAFIADARSCGVAATLADAFTYGHYDYYDIIFANRPSTMQDELEKIVAEGVAPGCVLVAANWRHDPKEYGLDCVAMEYERPVCGVWKRPE
jgi:SAM-dependent methyltransferase